MKRYLVILYGAVTLIVAGLPNNAFSYYFGTEDFFDGVTYDYGNPANIGSLSLGTYLGTVYEGDDNTETILDFLDWADDENPSLDLSRLIEVYFYGQNEENTLWTPELQSSGDGYISGTWQTYNPIFAAPAFPNVVDLIIVKGGNNFSVHLYDPAVNRGIWNVGYLPDEGGSGSPPSILHLSAYTHYAQTQPVPEPSSILLIGTGLFGLVAYQRKKWFSQQRLLTRTAVYF